MAPCTPFRLLDFLFLNQQATHMSRLPRERLGLNLLFAALALILSPMHDLARASEDFLYEEEPYDQITLNAEHDGAVLKVLPMELPDRTVPPDPKDGMFRIQLVDRPQKAFDISFADIAKIELFEQLLVDRAAQLTEQGDFDAAYDYIQHLYVNYPKYAAVPALVQQYLTSNALASFRTDRYDDALMLLEEAYRIDPQRPGISKSIGSVANKWIESYFQEQDYVSVQWALDRMRTRYAEQQEQLIETWTNRLQQLAQQKLQEARKSHSEGRYRDAQTILREAFSAAPELAADRELVVELMQDYPIVAVGVMQPALTQDADRLDDWASRRSGRLVHRTLLERTGYGADGGQYACPWGGLTLSDDGRNLTFQIRNDPTVAPDETSLTGYDVAQLLLGPSGPLAYTTAPAWAQLAKSVTVQDVFQVHVELNRSHVRPEAFLRWAISPAEASSHNENFADGPYHIVESSEQKVIYATRGGYPLTGPTQPKEIVEQHFANVEQAISSLAQGSIDVVDRIPPRHLPSVQNRSSVVLERYDVPTVHLLIPNHRDRRLARPEFRLALLYGINRNLILERTILGDQKIDGCRVLSGPFPFGYGADDNIGYANDKEIVPRPFDPEMAIVLAHAFGKPTVKGAEETDESQPEPLILYYPDTELPRAACHAIAEQLTILRIPCSAKPLPRGATRPDSEWDLVYAELTMSEPVIDARRLLGTKGLARTSGHYLPSALRELDTATNWRQARESLHRIHRLVHDQVTVIPLWQIAEHFAYRNILNGVGSQPVSLYQNIERWQVER